MAFSFDERRWIIKDTWRSQLFIFTFTNSPDTVPKRPNRWEERQWRCEREKIMEKMGECNITNCTFQMQHHFRIQLFYVFHIGILEKMPRKMSIHTRQIAKYLSHIQNTLRNVFIILSEFPSLALGHTLWHCTLNISWTVPFEACAE